MSSEHSQIVVNTDVESAGGQNDVDLMANTTGSIKVIVTKQDEEGKDEIIDEGEIENGKLLHQKRPPPILNEPSEMSH